MRNVKAQISLGCIFRKGEIVDQDLVKAAEWYKRAAKEGSQVAQNCLDLLDNNSSTPSNGDAHYQLGFLREIGEGLRQDIPQAIQIYTDLAKLKNPEAVYRLAKMYEIGNQVELNFQRVLFLYEKAADLGCLNAQFRLGQLYSDKNDSVFSVENTFRYYMMAADQNHPEAKYRLAIMYLDGIGVEQDFIQAYTLFSESRDLRCEDAENIFQVPIDYRKNFDIDYKKVAQIFKLVCEYGLNSLEYNLGYHYEYESIFHYDSISYINIDDIQKAILWYEAAAPKDSPEAQYRLGCIHEMRSSSSKWFMTSHYYLKSRRNGNPDAAYKLTCTYLNKNRVSNRFQKAFGLFVEASHKGPNEAANLLFRSYKAVKNKKQLTFKEILEEIVESGNIIIQYKLGLLNIEKFKS
jgi:TPR repeat protein